MYIENIDSKCQEKYDFIVGHPMNHRLGAKERIDGGSFIFFPFRASVDGINFPCLQRAVDIR